MLVTNNNSDPIAITAAHLVTPLYAGSNDWVPGPSGRSMLRPGTTVALPAKLSAAPSCAETPETGTAASAAAPAATVFLTFDGQEHEFTASDPYAALERLNQQDCLEQAVWEVAALEPMPELTVVPDKSSAVVRVSIIPTGSSGTITITGFGPTTLLSEDPRQPWPRNISVTGTDTPTVVSLSVVPARCDAHALAEDKTGTKLPLEAAAGNRSGQLRLDSPPAFTHSVYSFVKTACAQ